MAKRLKFSLPWFLFGYGLCRLAMAAMLSVRVKGSGRPDGIVFVAGKHVSTWDIPLVARGVRKCLGANPMFEMGTFIGYPILGHMRWMLEKFGGFEVMRPKDVLRLRALVKEGDEDPRKMMKRTNEAAGETRRAILASKLVLCYFPEGTRDSRAVQRFRSKHEIAEALALEAELGKIQVIPVVLRYGAKPALRIPFIRRQPVEVELLDPVPISGKTPEETLSAIQTAVAANWEPEPLR